MTVKSVAYPVFDPGGIKSLKTVNRVKVMMTEGKHDVAIITLRGENMNVPELQPGTPVQMQYGWAMVDMDWFYGYIDHIETHYDRAIPDATEYEDVVCVGVSYTMKDPFVGAWTNVPASSVVQQIAAQYYLSSLIEQGDYSWPSLGSPGNSAWSYLAQLADKIGYSLACNKSFLRFVSVGTAMSQYWPSMPVFQSRNTAPSFALQSLTQFQSLQGESTPLNKGAKAVRNINGMDLTSGKIFSATDDTMSLNDTKLGSTLVYPFFNKQVSDTVVVSQGHALAALSGMTEANRFPYQATATLSGLTSVKQGMPIVVSGIDSNNDGMWWVQEVTHRLLNQSYSMNVCLGRASLGDSGRRPQQGTAVAYSQRNPFLYAAMSAPPTVLLANRWRCSYAYNVNVAS